MNEDKERYETEITKRLDAFKTAKEWSDFISLLSSLDSTIKKFSIPDVPRKKLLFKRLNQCLNPVLPAGIHNKALETYALVFERISRENLVKDFDFLTLGLFTFSAHCRILVTSSFLDVMERHIVPLGRDIEDYCTSVLIGLLPPMEFESGEYYNRAHLIITEFKSLVSRRAFYTSVWSILLNDERLRTSVVNYVVGAPREDEIVGNVRLVSKALCASLWSESTLVVRSCLDLLIFVFPSRDDVGDKEIVSELVEAVIKLFVKRDLSLNKRIYSWLNLSNGFKEEDVGLLADTLRRFLSRNTPEDIQFFFRILMTLQDKGKLCERIMENLLFDALMCLETCRDEDASDGRQNTFGERSGENIDTEKIARMFLTTDLDSIWKIFYLKLKSSLRKHAKERMLLESNEDVDFGTEAMKEELSSMHTVSLILKEGSTAVESEANGSRAEESEGGGGSSEEEHDLLKGLLRRDKDGKRARTRRLRRFFAEGGYSMGPSQILHLVEFAASTYSIVDNEVAYHHLPFLTHLTLSSFLLFEQKTLFSFLSFSTRTMRFKDEQRETMANIQKLIDRFYFDENVEILDETSPVILYSLSEKMGKLAGYNIDLSYPVILGLVQAHGIDVFSTDFVQDYYKLTLTCPTRSIERYSRMYEMIDCSRLDPKEMFDVLWERFCYVEKDIYPKGSGKGKEDGSGEDVHTCSVSTSREDYDSEFVAKSRPIRRFFRSCIDEATDYRLLAELLFRYNTIFKNAFEEHLLKKVVEEQIEEICHFLFLRIENFGNGFDFLELYYVINCRMDPDNPTLAALLCSITRFDGLFEFLLRKLEGSNIYANDFSFVDSPDFNQIFGVLRCVRNLLGYSRRFRTMLCSSTRGFPSQVFSPATDLVAREMVYKALAYLLMNGKEYNSRKVNIEIMSVLRMLVEDEVVNANILNSPEIPRIIEMVGWNKNDPAIIFNAIPIVRCTGNSTAILDFCRLLDHRCFYYYSFLDFIFSLTDRLQRKAITNVLSSLRNEEFALMIMYEVMENLLTKRGVDGELSEFVDKAVRFILEFFESQYVCDGERGEMDGDPVSSPHEARRGVRRYLDELQESSFQDPPSKEHLLEMADVSGGNRGQSLLVAAGRGHGNLKMNALKLTAAKALSQLFFKKLPFRFVEAIIDNTPCLPFLRSMDFKEELYVSILSSHPNSPKVFRFLTVFNEVISAQELRGIFNKSRSVFEKISAYRVGSDYVSLQFSLRVLLTLELKEGDEALVQSIVLNSIYFLQRKVDMKTRSSESEYVEDINLLWTITDFKFAGGLLMVVPSLVSLVFTLVNSNNRVLKKIGIDFLIKLSEKGLEVRHWKREFLEIFHTLDFFTYRLYGKSLLMKKVVTEDPSIINDLIARLEGSFFASQASDANNKTLVLKRISYIIFSAPFNYFSGFSLKLVEKIASLISHPSPRVRREAFFLSKMLILKIPHDKLINLYPVLFYDVGVVVESGADEDVSLLAEVLRLLDIVFLLNTSQLSEIRLVFLDPRDGAVADTEGDVPLGELSIQEDRGRFVRKSMLRKLDDALRRKHTVESRSEIPHPVKKIPLLTSRRMEVEDILDFTSNVSSYYAWLDENCSEIDYEFLFYMTLRELKETV